MARTIITAVFLVLSVAGNAIAQSCDDGSDGPYCLFYGCYWDYTEPLSCYETGGNLSEASVCYSESGWEFGTGASSWAQVTFHVSETKDYFDAYSEVYFDDPNNSASNVISLAAFVDHPYTSFDDWYPLASHDGTDGDLNCTHFGGTFPASAGDVVTLIISVGKANSDASITAERLIIANWDTDF